MMPSPILSFCLPGKTTGKDHKVNPFLMLGELSGIGPKQSHVESTLTLHILRNNRHVITFPVLLDASLYLEETSKKL